MTALYVYALTGSAAEPFEAGDRRIEFTDLGGVFAASSRLAERPALTEASLRDQHDIVGAIAARVDAILPARFGSLVDPVALTATVTERRRAIDDALALVAGCEQMTVRVFAAPGTRRDVTPRPASGADYLRARADAARPSAIAPLLDAVTPLVRAERAIRGDRAVLATLYHLIRRGASREYEAVLDPIRARLAGPGFIVSGPWPPFAFAPELW